jgi:hypothetical protein
VLDDFSFLNVLVCVFFKYQLQVCLITKIWIYLLSTEIVIM